MSEGFDRLMRLNVFLKENDKAPDEDILEWAKNDGWDRPDIAVYAADKLWPRSDDKYQSHWTRPSWNG